ncbi:toxin VasX [Pseudomonas psychrophila]|uniref:toxin VasX n=1 Tax=Pseudomonas psychrophila TaxID=122355 RepID=UPI00069B4F27|nr:toxin VasX [Pseudomonas psychrophila]
MSAQKLAMIDNAAQAERAAKAQPHVDVKSPLTPCPAHQPEVFVVPVRYALAQEQATHPCCSPGVTTQSHPMAARRLRVGFLYLWQEKGPLQRYAVSPTGRLQPQALEAEATHVPDGMLTGLALHKHHDAWMLYTEFPLDPQHCALLSDNPAKRSAHMRHVALRTVANELQADHCPPLEHATEVMAELNPDTYAQSMKADQKAGGDDTRALGETVMKAPSKANIKAYTDAMYRAREREKIIAQHPGAPDQAPGEWSAEPWDGQGTQTWLEAATAEARALYPVFVCLDDDLGVLRDINHDQERVESSHEQWVGDNNLRLNIGGFIRSLITEDGAEVAGTLSYRYKDRDISLTPEQGKIMLDAQQRLEEALKIETQNRQYGGQPSRAEAAARDAHIQSIVGPVRSFIPSDLYTEVEALVREYRAEKQSNLDNDHFSAKVSEYIDLPAMNTWLDTTAPVHYQHVEQRHNALFADRGQYLTRSHSGTWFVDYYDVESRQWLTELATGCLSAQCTRAKGAEQYADYVRAPDEGALKHLFHAWTPSIDAGIVGTGRLGEILAALGSENREATRQLFAPLSAVIANDIAAMARHAQEPWSVLVNRLAASLLILKGDKTFSSAWVGIFVAARLGSDARLQAVTHAGRQIWTLLGEKAEGLNHWVKTTGQAIGAGRMERVTNSPLISNSGGVVPLAALLLNTLNANNYLSQAAALEGMDDQRVNDTVSASLYASAALVAVVDSQVRKGLGRDRFHFYGSAGPTLTLFGGVIGGLSAYAALNEFYSLQIQLENAQTHIDPWLEMRQTVVGGQVVAYGAQALLGVFQTSKALAGLIEVEVAIMRYTLYMGPLNWIIAALGVLYLISWFFQQTPVQNFLNSCCWSKARARKLDPIPAKAQQNELHALYGILYTPRVSMQSSSETGGSNGPSGLSFVSSINALTIDLPGAEPGTAYLELSMMGDPVGSQAYRYLIKNSPHNNYKPPRPWRDMAPHWLSSSACQWIPFQEGQGLRLSGPFKTLSNVISTSPATVSLRLRYRTPLIAMLGAHSFVGGERGVAFTLTNNDGVIALRNDPTPELDRVPAYALGKGHPGAIYLQPKDKP